MDADETWAAVDVLRARAADLLDTLAVSDWERPSLCTGWRIRDVAAHLAMQPIPLGAGLRGFLRHPGPVNHLIHWTARDRAAAPTGQLVADLRATIGLHRPNPGLTETEALIDIVVHGQDIAVPLGRELPVPVEAAASAATRMQSYRASRRARKKLRVFRPLPHEGYRFVATDTAWSSGAGPEISGPMLAILLVLTGRPVGLAQLTGAEALARQVAPAQP